MEHMHMTGPMWMPMAPPTLGRLLAWHPQPLPVEPIVCLLALALYALAVWRLRRRGDRWPITRTLLWTVGVISVALVTCTGVGGYGMELFSVHMVQHMVLSMLSPILLLLGAPVTLALRVLPAAGRGRTGPREVITWFLHSRLARVVSSPLFTLPLFIASLYGLYFTPLFDFTMRSWLGHEWMLAHFLATGLLFFWPIMGVDPAPRRPSHVMRMLELFIGMPFHAFFGIAVMMSSGLIVGFFAHPPAAWQVTPLADQNTGGGIAWAFSEIPTVLVLLAVLVQWAATERRAAACADRQAERDHDAQLAAYNAYLSRLATWENPG
ncbi:cytochrome c oxidase assembly protein [Streptomyces silvisoli]|uniref:Cytochrome c oxidase assembly protein n=1 Tax=Streptomyces silvisoli TaxID=3034235 RepID=A0ABT5ZQT8_9ACTN|nr:cytochrome c oxidase assembly protein [Streptomyces silvisoli]MDF3291924.1 cytochrome c oxidase assembly protein [Streptomyces silvisoli]